MESFVKRLRKAKKLTQIELAEAMKVQRHSVIRWESDGLAGITLEKAARLALILDCEITDLFKEQS